MKKPTLCAIVLVGCLAAVPAAGGQGFPSERSRVEYSHTSTRGNPCRFEIGPKGGEADYYWDGARQRDKLEPAGQASEKDQIYSVYKVIGKSRWFFFPVKAIERRGEKDYPMRYSLRGSSLEGSVAIPTRGTTRIRMFEIADGPP